MDSTSAHSKYQRVGEATAEIVDRISGLPDSVLCHILSFLPTKYAVGTCILSTRWKNVFTSISNLDFDDTLLLHPRMANENPAREITTFMNFVDRVLVLRKAACIDRFCLKCLKCGQDIDASRVNAWICAALCRDIQELDLCIYMKEFAMLPRKLFTCRTLVNLKLGHYFLLNVPIKVCLPNLKIIHLKDVEFVDDDSIQRLISSCPLLEDLVIEGCGLGNMTTFSIRAPALKRLTVNCVDGTEFNSKFCKYKIMIDAPNLLYLKYYDFVPEGFLAKNLLSLVMADIDVVYGSEQLVDGNPNRDESIAGILVGISKAESLSFSEYFVKAIGLSHQMLPTFSNLIHLELGNVGWRILADLLKNSPILGTLDFLEGFLDDSCQWDLPQCVPSCLLLHLKTIEIMLFSGCENELHIVTYFLKNASFLEKMTIHICDLTEKEELMVSKELLMLPRGSKECQLAIV